MGTTFRWPAALLRLLATACTGGFRAMPAIIIIYLIGFGLPLTEAPFLSSLSPVWLAVFFLTLAYGAEVFRAPDEPRPGRAPR
ncbi:hypothetical protein ACWEGV_01380, partial [Streptomyces sp. NPDC004976]